MKNKIWKIISYSFQLLIHRPRSWWRVLINQFFHTLLKSSKAPCYPAMAVIEPTNHCNQKCDYCLTGMGQLGRPLGTMSFEQYKVIIDQIGPHLAYLELYNMGEPFLNEDIYSMISYTKEKYKTYIKIDTNGMIIDSQKILESGLDEIWFEIGGLSQETHSVYRTNGNIDSVLRNMKELLKRRAKTPDSKIEVKSGLIVMKHNEHEIKEFQALEEAIGLDQAMIIKPTVKDYEQGRKFLPDDKSYWLYDQEEFEKGKLIRRDLFPEKCPISWNSVFIAWNGDVYPCAKDHNDEYCLGNMLKDDFVSIWNNRKARNFRGDKVKGKELKMCDMCPGYGAMPWFNHIYHENKYKP